MVRKIFYRLFLILVVSSAASFLHAQTRFIDSLKEILPKQTHKDTIRLTTLNLLARAQRAVEMYDDALTNSEEAVALGEFLKTAKENLKDSVYYKKVNTELGIAWNNKGEIFRLQSVVPKAMESYLKALAIWEELHNNRGMASAYNNMGILFENQKNYDESLKYLNEALKVRVASKDLIGEASSYNNIGTVYLDQEKFDAAKAYILKAKQIFESKKEFNFLSNSLNNLGVITEKIADRSPKELQQPLYEEALQYHLQSLSLKRKINNKRGMASSFNNLGEIFSKLGNFFAADTCLQRSMQLLNSSGMTDLLNELYGSLSHFHYLKGVQLQKAGNNREAAIEFRLSYEMQQEQNKLKDAELLSENNKKILQMQFQYRQEKLDRIKALEEQAREEKLKSENERQRIITYFVLFILLLTATLLFFIYRSYRHKKKANHEISEQKRLLEEKQKEILDSITYARRIQSAIITSEFYIARALKKLGKRS